MDKQTASSAIVALVITISIYLILNPLETTGAFVYEETIVTRVIDGDTIEIDGGERVRFLGADTPETGQFLYAESTEFIKELIEGKSVKMEADGRERDKYDRLLRHIHYNDIFVNLELVKRGYGSSTVLTYEPDSKYADLFLKAEAEARQQELGIWQYPEESFCLTIHSFHYNAKGNDNENLNNEYIEFRNKCFSPIDISGWHVKDKANHTYTFKSVLVENKTKIKLHTGSGEDSETDVYWSSPFAVWNNNGDELRMWNSKGSLVLKHTY
jgi:micrococcal nuclease